MGKKSKGGFYAVRRGRTPGVYLTWAECEEQVKGVSNDYKRFDTEDEALSYAFMPAAGAACAASAGAVAVYDAGAAAALRRPFGRRGRRRGGGRGLAATQRGRRRRPRRHGRRRRRHRRPDRAGRGDAGGRGARGARGRRRRRRRCRGGGRRASAAAAHRAGAARRGGRGYRRRRRRRRPPTRTRRRRRTTSRAATQDQESSIRTSRRPSTRSFPARTSSSPAGRGRARRSPTRRSRSSRRSTARAACSCARRRASRRSSSAGRRSTRRRGRGSQRERRSRSPSSWRARPRPRRGRRWRCSSSTRSRWSTPSSSTGIASTCRRTKLVFCGDFIQLPPVPDKQGSLDNSQHAHACVAAARRQDAPERQGVPGGATGTEAKRRAGLKDPAVDDGFWLDHKRNTPFGLKEVTGKYAFQSIAWRKARFQVHHLKVVHPRASRCSSTASPTCARACARRGSRRSSTRRAARSASATASNRRRSSPTVKKSRTTTSRSCCGCRRRRRQVYEALDEVQIDEYAPSWIDEAKMKGDSFFSSECQAGKQLELRIGAQVMLLRNETAGADGHELNVPRSRRLVNGSRGVVIGFDYAVPDSCCDLDDRTGGGPSSAAPTGEQRTCTCGKTAARACPMGLCGDCCSGGPTAQGECSRHTAEGRLEAARSGSGEYETEPPVIAGPPPPNGCARRSGARSQRAAVGALQSPRGGGGGCTWRRSSTASTSRRRCSTRWCASSASAARRASS